jgi:hypothetical protein
LIAAITSSSEVGDAIGLSQDSGSSDSPAVSYAPLRLKGSLQFTLRNAMDPTTFLAWWLHFKAEASNKQGFALFWSTSSACYAQHNAKVVLMLTQIIQDDPARTKLTSFVSSDDPHRGRRVVDGLRTVDLPSPRLRSATPSHAMYLPSDQTDYENRLNLVRMDLEQLRKPLVESTLLGAVI